MWFVGHECTWHTFEDLGQFKDSVTCDFFSHVSLVLCLGFHREEFFFFFF
jgi:hypothetical protein